MNKLIGIACVFMLLGGGAQAAEKSSLENIHSRHMLAEAMLTAHFVAAALKAGMGREEINAVLTDIAEHSAVTEFWVTDAKGRPVFTNFKGPGFTFPTDPKAGTQAAPFAQLLDRTKIRGGAEIPSARIRPQGLQVCWRIGSRPDPDRARGSLRHGHEQAVTIAGKEQAFAASSGASSDR